MYKPSKYFFVLLFIAAYANALGQSSAQQSKGDVWLKAKNILAEIKAPVFPTKNFLITNYGAIGDGIVNCSQAIKNAIQACSKAGGGHVIIPAGNFYTGPIYLKSNVDLHLNKGGKLSFSTQPNDYLPLVKTRWEGVELMNYSPLIYAYREQNIAITGEGTLDGRASNNNWWPWKGKSEYGWKQGAPNQTDKGNRPVLFDMAEKNVPVKDRQFGDGHYLRPQFIQPYLCNNVLIKGVQVINSPMWILHPVLCTNVTIDSVNVESNGPNTDGCDPESCKNVVIKNCYFNTGDDCIALKSGRNRDGRRLNVPCENVVIQNCTMANGHGGIVIGSEISGGVKSIVMEGYSKSPIQNVKLSNIKIEDVKTPYKLSNVTNIFLDHVSINGENLDQGKLVIDHVEQKLHW
ncbi:MAG: glycoside hydrolase family 28 protein [Sphingobacteriaceae bacterium]|nr:MAG: glycoside hydrolase family 28 protein [Sphingobacteriaceae bacterium]